MSSNNNLFDVNGKVVIVTGANRGNGLVISEGLAELGAKVIRVDKKFDKIIGSLAHENVFLMVLLTHY